MPAFFFERNKYRDAFTIKFVFPKQRRFGYFELGKTKKIKNKNKTMTITLTPTQHVLFCFSTPSQLNPTSSSSNASPSNAYYLAEPLNPSSSITPSLSLDSSSPT